MDSKPTHEQAKLQLELYDMRRETRLRQGRDWLMKNYFADNLDEAMKLAPPGSENGQLLFMTLTYWDQACAMLNYGLLHEDLFFETSGEFYGVWERVKPMVSQFRERFAASLFLHNLEKAAHHYETWIEKRSPGHLARMREFMTQWRNQMQKAA